MVRSFIAAVMTLALGGILKAELYNIQVWPDDLDKVPCEAWKKNPDGSLTQTGTIVVANSHSVITGNTFTDAPTIRVVEKKCGAELSSRDPRWLGSKQTKIRPPARGSSGNHRREKLCHARWREQLKMVASTALCRPWSTWVGLSHHGQRAPPLLPMCHPPFSPTSG
jgi:hypothetical protein